MGLFYVVSSWLSVAHYLISATIVNQHASWRFSAALLKAVLMTSNGCTDLIN